MIVFLLGSTHAPSAALRALAGELERHDSSYQVTVVDLPLAPPGTSQRPGSRPLDELTGLVEETAPDEALLWCTLENASTVHQLGRHLWTLWPRLPLGLLGPRARWVGEQLVPHGPARLVCWHGLPRRLGGEQPGGAPVELPAERIDELARAAARLDTAVAVGSLAHDGLALHQLRANGLEPRPSRGLGLAQAVAWTRPLLRGGITVRLADEALLTDGRQLKRFLHQVGPGRLVLPLAAELLDPELVQLLLRVGPQAVELELHPLLLGQLEPQQLEPQLRLLQERGVHLSGSLLIDPPGLDAAGFARGVDRCLRAGLERLRFHRLLVPPESALRADPTLLVDRRPPHLALRHGGAGPAELLRRLRFCDTLELLRGSLQGTGMLRALGQATGSAFDLVDCFAEGLSAGHGTLLPGGTPRQVERQFADFLRDHHGIDLRAGVASVRLKRSAGLTLRWLGNGSRLVSDEGTGREAHVGRGALELIDRCDRALTIHELCEQLVAEAPLERRDRLRRDLRLTVDKLATMGFLVPHAVAGELCPEPPFVSLEEFDYHYRMLMDSARVEAYRQAIGRVVQPGDHVIEVGTGTGILAVLAAQRGARVTAIERYAVLEMARAIAARSGVERRIEFIRGRSDLVQLEQPGDVLISELVGNRILNEGLLEATLDARRRMLRPGARLIPQRIEILAQLGHTDLFGRLQREVSGIGQRYEVRLEPLNEWLASSMSRGGLVWEMGSREGGLTPLSAEVSALTLDLGRLEEVTLDHRFEVPVQRAGAVNAVVLCFRLELQPGVELSTLGQHGLHWSKPVFILDPPLAASRGDSLGFVLHYDRGGELRLLPA